MSGPGAHYCSAHSAQLPAPMTSDHWLPVLQLSPAPIGEGSSSVVIINIHYDPANDNYSHAAMEGELAQRSVMRSK